MWSFIKSFFGFIKWSLSAIGSLMSIIEKESEDMAKSAEAFKNEHEKYRDSKRINRLRERIKLEQELKSLENKTKEK